MSWWSALLLGAIVLLAIALFRPLRIRLNGKARIEPTLAWAAAGAVSLGPFTLSAAAARDVVPRAHLHLFRWRIATRTLERAKKPESDEPRRTLAETWDAMVAGYERAKHEHERWSTVVDPIDVLFFLLDETARVRLGELTISGSFGADDVTVTGAITGYGYVLDALLGPRVSVDPHPNFSGTAPIVVDVDGTVLVFPALFAFDTLRFVLRRVRLSALPRAISPRPLRHST